MKVITWLVIIVVRTTGPRALTPRETKLILNSSQIYGKKQFVSTRYRRSVRSKRLDVS